MQGCVAPSEVLPVGSDGARVFGDLAEEIIYADFHARFRYSPLDLYVDDRNPANYVYFLQLRNPHLQQSSQELIGVFEDLGMSRPDLLIHAPLEKAFYEIKPGSSSGWNAGVEKLAYLNVTYQRLRLPYQLGMRYTGTRIQVAGFGARLRAYLRTELTGPGLIQYWLCLECEGVLELLTLAALLRYIIKKMNEQSGQPGFRPIDLGPAFAREGELAALATALGMGMAIAARRVPWSFFWKAVARRFAARGALAALLSAADGPLPVGELISVGMALWTVVDIIRLSDVLWNDAANLQRQGA